MPITTSRDARAARRRRGARSSSGIERLAALEREALVAEVLRVEEALEGSRRRRASRGSRRLLAASRAGVVARGLHALLQPVLPLGLRDVHVLDADRAAVGLAQDLDDLAQRHAVAGRRGRPSRTRGRGPRSSGRRSPGSSSRCGARFDVERVEVGDQVAAHAVGVDELQHPRLLLDLLAVAGAPKNAGVRVDLPAHRADAGRRGPRRSARRSRPRREQLLDAREEGARLGALDDAVVVGRRERHDLADAEQAERPRGHRPELGRVVDGAGRDDQALAGHEARHGRASCRACRGS